MLLWKSRCRHVKRAILAALKNDEWQIPRVTRADPVFASAPNSFFTLLLYDGSARAVQPLDCYLFKGFLTNGMDANP